MSVVFPTSELKPLTATIAGRFITFSDEQLTVRIEGQEICTGWAITLIVNPISMLVFASTSKPASIEPFLQYSHYRSKNPGMPSHWQRFPKFVE